MATISKKLLEHLAELARIELTADESKKLLKDLKKILKHFEELKELDTTKTAPMTGGTLLRNIFREDEVDFGQKSEMTNIEGRIIDSFPEVEKGFLKVPKVFE
ncbi:MAG: Asp-tRNA(Asn)/Glu-tRNA(Gln) amidotransferase subunit GatC [Patescibacteria group bacterium]